MQCPSCGSENLPGADECEHCQTSLMQEDVPPAVIRSRMDRSLLEDTVAKLRPVAPVCVRADASLAEAIDAMRAHGISCILIIDDDEQLIGILSERDLLRKVAIEPVDLALRPVVQFMTSDPETTKLDHPLAHAVHRMVIGDHRHLPLVDADGRPTGIVSSRDIVHYIAAQFRDVPGGDVPGGEIEAAVDPGAARRDAERG